MVQKKGKIEHAMAAPEQLQLEPGLLGFKHLIM